MLTVLQFEKIFVINLASRTDHRDGLGLAASFSGLKVDWIPGVPGNEILDRVLPPKRKDFEPSNGVKGCWRAHMNTLFEYVSL